MHSAQGDAFESTDDFIARLHRDWSAAYALMLRQQEAMRLRMQAHRRPTDIAVGDEVLVNVKAYDRPTLHPHGPLMPYFAGPYRVLRKITSNTFELQIPQPHAGQRIHPVFNVSHLRKYHSNRPLLDALENADDVPPDPPEADVLPEDEPGDGSAADVDLPPAQLPPPPPVPPEPVVARPRVRGQDRVQTESVLSDKHILRQLFQRYCSSTETNLMTAQDQDGHVDVLPTNGDRHDVMLDPYVFRRVSRELRFKPSVDLFANVRHHQVPRYFALGPDPHAAGDDAFKQDWSKEERPYANPPWPLIGKVLKKVAQEKLRIMMIVPQWPKAPWFDLLRKISEKSVVLTDPVYLAEDGHLRPKPWGNTEVHILDGKLAVSS